MFDLVLHIHSNQLLFKLSRTSEINKLVNFGTENRRIAKQRLKSYAWDFRKLYNNLILGYHYLLMIWH